MFSLTAFTKQEATTVDHLAQLIGCCAKQDAGPDRHWFDIAGLFLFSYDIMLAWKANLPIWVFRMGWVPEQLDIVQTLF